MKILIILGIQPRYKLYRVILWPDFQREKIHKFHFRWLKLCHCWERDEPKSIFNLLKWKRTLEEIWYRIILIIYHWMLTRVPRTWTFSSANFHINYMSMNFCFHFTVLNKNSQRQNFEKITWEMLYNKHEIFQKIKNEMQPADSKF